MNRLGSVPWRIHSHFPFSVMTSAARNESTEQAPTISLYNPDCHVYLTVSEIFAIARASSRQKIGPSTWSWTEAGAVSPLHLLARSGSPTEDDRFRYFAEASDSAIRYLQWVCHGPITYLSPTNFKSWWYAIRLLYPVHIIANPEKMVAEDAYYQTRDLTTKCT